MNHNCWSQSGQVGRQLGGPKLQIWRLIGWRTATRCPRANLRPTVNRSARRRPRRLRLMHRRRSRRHSHSSSPPPSRPASHRLSGDNYSPQGRVTPSRGHHSSVPGTRTRTLPGTHKAVVVASRVPRIQKSGNPGPGLCAVLSTGRGHASSESHRPGNLLNVGVSKVLASQSANLPVGGRLKHFVDEWKRLGASKRVIRWLEQGYPIRFKQELIRSGNLPKLTKFAD